MWREPDAQLIAHAPVDLVDLVGFVREVEVAYRRNVESGATAMHLRGDLREAIERLDGGGPQ
jgi:hypothetical protein